MKEQKLYYLNAPISNNLGDDDSHQADDNNKLNLVDLNDAFMIKFEVREEKGSDEKDDQVSSSVFGPENDILVSKEDDEDVYELAVKRE